jgi:hypothetical protein
MHEFLNLDPEWKKFGSGIRVKHPGSATLLDLRSNNLDIKSEKLDKTRNPFSLENSFRILMFLILSQNFFYVFYTRSEGSVYGYEYRIAEPVGSRTSFFPNPLKFVTELGSVLY